MNDDRFDRLLGDVEAADAGARLHERHGEFGDLVAEAFADSALQSRLAGALGSHIELDAAGERIVGRLDRVGEGWCALEDVGPVVVSLSALDRVRLRTPAHRAPGRMSALSIASALRDLAQRRSPCRIHGMRTSGAAGTGITVEGVLDAVARDYVQVRRGGGAFDLIPIGAIALVRELAG